MNKLVDKIIQEGRVIENRILKVDNFLNHQIDVELFNWMGQEFKERFKDKDINKIMTLETSGIGIACIVAQYFDNVPVVFAKKYSGTNMDTSVYEADVYSFTKNKDYKIRVSKNYLCKNDKVLIIDDFLAMGSASAGLISLCEQAGAAVEGIGIAIEKKFQQGREEILSKGIQLESLAIVEALEDGKVVFSEE
ncbi:xanthine phosphoribosyltransferase [Clostridium pascui]|uniref:xanthine phosphoribosyltransferase n=1 Tax=Clostridium pascui TaxID=46609 RepID=UPI00195DC1EC|nr:xanthine phosphoribosyltransferase [Clostridium pascui]MBM7871877.1 xanthine phosphoribosyltransferase [Clostridium pascui]